MLVLQKKFHPIQLPLYDAKPETGFVEIATPINKLELRYFRKIPSHPHEDSALAQPIVTPPALINSLP